MHGGRLAAATLMDLRAAIGEAAARVTLAQSGNLPDQRLQRPAPLLGRRQGSE
jgi:hypothetical protein